MLLPLSPASMEPYCSKGSDLQLCQRPITGTSIFFANSFIQYVQERTIWVRSRPLALVRLLFTAAIKPGMFFKLLSFPMNTRCKNDLRAVCSVWFGSRTWKMSTHRLTYQCLISWLCVLQLCKNTHISQGAVYRYGFLLDFQLTAICKWNYNVCFLFTRTLVRLVLEVGLHNLHFCSCSFLC